SPARVQAVLSRAARRGLAGTRLRDRLEHRAHHRRGPPRHGAHRQRAGRRDGRHNRSAGARMTTPRVLVIEDEAGLRLTLGGRLASEGYSVDTAIDGESGLERASARAHDVIVLDVMLPKINGFDVCRELRRRGVDTPILMLTARGQVVDKVVGLKLGADDYL